MGVWLVRRAGVGILPLFDWELGKWTGFTHQGWARDEDAGATPQYEKQEFEQNLGSGAP